MGRMMAMHYNRWWSLALGGTTEGFTVIVTCNGLLLPAPIADHIEMVCISEQGRVLVAHLRCIGKLLCIDRAHNMLAHGQVWSVYGVVHSCSGMCNTHTEQFAVGHRSVATTAFVFSNPHALHSIG